MGVRALTKFELSGAESYRDVESSISWEATHGLVQEV